MNTFYILGSWLQTPKDVFLLVVVLFLFVCFIVVVDVVVLLLFCLGGGQEMLRAFVRRL